MRKLIQKLAIGLTAALVVAAGVLLDFSRHDPIIDEILSAVAGKKQFEGVSFETPQDDSLFPPDLAAPTFRWKDSHADADLWLIVLEFQDREKSISVLVKETTWRPKPSLWETIKKRSIDQPATVTVVGVNSQSPRIILSSQRIRIQTSVDPVGAPLFYREVNLPFVEAVKDPSNIRWRFGSVSSATQPPIVLEKMPVCGNCHSFSADGSLLGMDIDYANDKGSYAIVPIQRQITLDRQNIITWSEFKRNEGDPTFGLLSQVSPDGRYVVSTVKDESVFVPKPGLDFSQLFFPIKGILCIYDRQTASFRSLPGADNPAQVQSNPVWSPDGKYLLFAAAESYQLKNVAGPRKVLLSPEDCREFLQDGKPFRFDIYRIPFNEGNGGVAEPLKGASGNGMSNFFPRYSPDGKWIVFCKAKNYMLLQPDSELYIIPAEGGDARRLRANTPRMNSWHSFSPNGKWLVFSGKPQSPYTRLFLTHIDEQGDSTPPIVLEHLTSPDRAANIPEFVNANATAIGQIRQRFIDDVSFVRAAREFLKGNDYDGAQRQAQKAIEFNPKNSDAYDCLGLAMFGRKDYDQAIVALTEAIRLEPSNSVFLTHLGSALIAKNLLNEAIVHLNRSVQIDPDNIDAYYNLGTALYRQGDKPGAILNWTHAVRCKPQDTEVRYNLARTFEETGQIDSAIVHYRQIVEQNPGHIQAQAKLGMALCSKAAFQEGAVHLSNALNLDPDNKALRFNLAITLARMKQHEQAMGHWLQLLQNDPRNASVRLNLAMSYVELGRREDALDALTIALRDAQSARDEKLIGQIDNVIQRIQRSPPPSNPKPQ
ncbi:MAG: tetratricopeptide repeat protein [Phycisphaerae bacterium]|nr:tetratricopeptide repeat protein [Phycisphaerae bacterium]